MRDARARRTPRRTTLIPLLMASVLSVASPVALAGGPSITKFWKPWFLDIGGGTPVADAPFLELSGDLHPGTTLYFQCWGLHQPDVVRLVIGVSLDLLPGPGGATLVPHPALVLDVPVRTYDDDGPSGPKPSYSMLQAAIPFSGVPALGPGICVQVWAKTGSDWVASNAVAASFTIAAQS